MTNIIFPPLEEENPDNETVDFHVQLDGIDIECTVSYEVLRKHFDADYADPLFAFMTGRSKFEKMIRERLLAGHHTETASIDLVSADFSDI
ncbi:MAG: DUF1488 domain-containing protein [Anaerolineales bacterium]